MFEKFYRTDEAHSSGVLGTGLGMYITKESVERKGGQIGFESELNKASTFGIKLKTAPKPGPHSPSVR